MTRKSETRIFGLIPARGGSKRIKNKNIRLLGNKPLIVYTIEAARQARNLCQFAVSTDDDEIADVCTRAGAPVPFMRPKELASDDTPDKPVLIHAVEWFEKENGFLPDYVMLLRPTTPFKTSELIDRLVDVATETLADSLRTVTRAEGVHHPYWMFRRDPDGRAQPVIPGIEVDKYYRRQLLPQVYRLNGVVDVIKTQVLLHHRKLYGDDMRIVEVSEEESVDIDTELDLALAEVILSRRAPAPKP